MNDTYKKIIRIVVLMAATTINTAAVAAEKTISSATPVPALDLRQTTDLASLTPALSKYRVIIVGESHDRYEHHLLQLDVIKAIHNSAPKIAIGMEMFQRPFQPVLDQYIKGEIDETTMLEQTEYFKRWRFDYRLYAPILRYAREHGIPLIALNISKDITDQISEDGLDSLSADLKNQLPKHIERNNAAYDARIGAVFAGHPGADKKDIQRFRDIQLIWDEGMAETAANYLSRHPASKMIILAGAGHVAYRDGIPNRLERRIKQRPASLLPADAAPLEPGIADYLLFPTMQELPKPGLIGVSLEPTENGMQVAGFSDQSAGKSAGIKKGDILVNIDGRKIQDMQDVQLAMWNKSIGDTVTIKLTSGDHSRIRWLKIKLN